MPLSASATLEGYAIFARVPLHTYVRSSCGAVWGCWGSSTGGRSVCNGNGSSIQAACIEGGDNAGIFYYVTGVCHQTANRILWPAGVVLPDGAHADIRSSYFLYDEYGKNFPGWPLWPDRANICSHGNSGPSSGTGSSSHSPSPRSSSMTFGFQQGGPNPRSRMARLLEAGLGHSVDLETCDQLIDLQAQLQTRQQELARLLLTKEIGRERYISELDRVMKDISSIGEKILGQSEFHKVFGEFRVHNLGDAEKFVSDPSDRR